MIKNAFELPFHGEKTLENAKKTVEIGRNHSILSSRPPPAAHGQAVLRFIQELPPWLPPGGGAQRGRKASENVDFKAKLNRISSKNPRKS